MFIVRWEGDPPPDREEWIEVMKEVLMGATGSYWIRFYPGPEGWKFDFECREDLGGPGSDVVSNSPESTRFNLYHALTRRGKPLDPNWRE